MQLRKLIFLFSILLMNGQIQASPVENVQGPVHEAFFTPVTGAVAYQAISDVPPEVVLERVPKQTKPDTVWISGYWQFNEERDDFIWISGVWRKPPPDRTWISGYWKKFSEGWVWLGGFWSDKEESDLDFIGMAPPQTAEENVGAAPGENYFWTSGYWSFDGVLNQFNWVSGAWVPYDDELVLVPAHYVWRESGFVFVSSYWDWKLENRGVPFTSLFIPVADRTGYIYDPVVVLEPLVICHYYFSWYPDYLYFYNFHHHFYPDVWNSWGITPPWWGWNSWWSFDWHNSWALWWWWGNPGYPAPSWMSTSLAQQIAPPSKLALAMFRDTKPPVFVTPSGVVSADKLVGVIQENIPALKRKPILPANRKAIDKVAVDITKSVKGTITEVRPSGKLGPIPADLARPLIADAKTPSQIRDKAQLPNKPGKPNVIRPRPDTPGSNLKPMIRKSVFVPKVPNLAPALERTPQRDVYRPQVEIPAASDRSRIQFENPEKADRPPYNKPTRIIEPSRAPDRSYQMAPSYVAPNYSPIYQDRTLQSNIYDMPQTSRTIIRQPASRKNLRNQSSVDPFNPEGFPSKKGKSAHFPPRPVREPNFRERNVSPVTQPINQPSIVPQRDAISPQQMQLNMPRQNQTYTSPQQMQLNASQPGQSLDQLERRQIHSDLRQNQRDPALNQSQPRRLDQPVPSAVRDFSGKGSTPRQRQREVYTR